MGREAMRGQFHKALHQADLYCDYHYLDILHGDFTMENFRILMISFFISDIRQFGGNHSDYIIIYSNCHQETGARNRQERSFYKLEKHLRSAEKSKIFKKYIGWLKTPQTDEPHKPSGVVACVPINI